MKSFTHFNKFTPSSSESYDFSDWDFVLKNTVIRLGPSNRFKGKKPRPNTGSKFSLANNQASWLEGNRVYYEALTEEQILALEEYRQILETLPTKTPLRNLSKDNQLAYWLNLYNVTIYSKIARRYPITSLKLIYDDGFWDEKVLNVEGIHLSLNDIQNEILIANWESPLVIYGLYQGSIGGPNIQYRAFTGANVWERLNLNAKDFINSIRGTHKRGKNLRVSKFYEWTKNAFPDFEKDLLHHLNAYADDKTQKIINSTTAISPTYYDWHITDLYNGYPKAVRIYASTATFMNGDTVGTDLLAPLHVQEFTKNIVLKFKVFGFPETSVTIDEVQNKNQ